VSCTSCRDHVLGDLLRQREAVLQHGVLGAVVVVVEELLVGRHEGRKASVEFFGGE